MMAVDNKKINFLRGYLRIFLLADLVSYLSRQSYDSSLFLLSCLLSRLRLLGEFLWHKAVYFLLEALIFFCS